MVKRIRLDNLGLMTQDERGRMARMDLPRPEVERLEGMEPGARMAQLMQYPALAHFFTPEGALDADFDILVDWTADCLTGPLRIYYGIEPYCDLNCRFCGPRKLEFGTPGHDEKRERFVLKEIADAGTFQVQLTGGEVFLRAEGLFDLLDICAELHLGVLLATNGLWSRIKDKKAFAARLSGYDNLAEIKVSVDGDEPFHDTVRGLKGSYSAAVDTARVLREQGLPVRLNATIFKDSCETRYIDHLAGLARDLGTGLQAVPERACGRSLGRDPGELPSKEQLMNYSLRARELRETLNVPISFNFDVLGGGRTLPDYDRERPFSCGAGLWGFAVTHEGEVFPCGFAIEAGADRRFFCGTVEHPGDLLSIWRHSPVLRDWRQAEKSPRCQACSHYRVTCWGGCKVQAYMMSGSLSAEDPYCFTDCK